MDLSILFAKFAVLAALDYINAVKITGKKVSIVMKSFSA